MHTIFNRIFSHKAFKLNLKKKPFLFFIALSFIIVLPSSLFARECAYPPFEKIYVGPSDILTTSEGIFLVSSNGERERVRAVRSDCHGTYVIKFVQECPVCGRLYSEKKSKDDGYDCPLGELEIKPHLWCK